MMKNELNSEDMRKVVGGVNMDPNWNYDLAQDYIARIIGWDRVNCFNDEGVDIFDSSCMCGSELTEKQWNEMMDILKNGRKSQYYKE